MPWPSSVLHKAHSGDNSRAGFGLIELMVSISIMVIVAGIILARQDSFNGAVLLRGQAYEIAFAIREVQLEAVSTRNNTGSGDFRTAMGLRIDSRSDNNQHYDVFIDTDEDGRFDLNEQLGQRGVIDSRFIIEAIVTDGNRSDYADILFKRPNFDAILPWSSSEVLIYVRRIGTSGYDTSAVRVIEVTSTGQISVRTGSSSPPPAYMTAYSLYDESLN